MDYQKYRQMKMREYGILTVCWGVPLPGESTKIIVSPGQYTATYERTSCAFWICSQFSLYRYDLIQLSFLEIDE